jgi:hypothetical protein
VVVAVAAASEASQVRIVTLPFRSLWRGGRRPRMLRFDWRCSGSAVGRPLLACFHGGTSQHTLGLSEHGPVLVRLLLETTLDRRQLEQ